MEIILLLLLFVEGSFQMSRLYCLAYVKHKQLYYFHKKVNDKDISSNKISNKEVMYLQSHVQGFVIVPSNH